MGGFDDDEGLSRELSKFLLNLLVEISKEECHFMRFTLRTCAISSLNDDGSQCPIGRGLGMDTKTGQVFLAEVDRCIAGPALVLRASRLWSGMAGKKLHVIHNVDDAYNSDIVVHPFKFQTFRNLDLFLRLPDNIMIQYASTSPDVEKPNYCQNTRKTLRFIRQYKWQSIFGTNCDHPLIFRRKSGNEWEQV